MPGLYRSPGLADIDVCYGKRQQGTEALKRTSQRYQDESAAAQELLQRPRRSVTLPTSGAYYDDNEDDNDDDETRDIWSEEGRRGEQESRDVEMSEGSMHEGYGERRAEETGLPPTPPEGLTKDERQQEPQPLFADGVRNALSSQKSGALSTTPVNNPQLSPPTPDTTPPAHPGHDVNREDTPEVPLNAWSNLHASRPQLETFRTAREELPIFEDEGKGDVVLPDSDRLPDHWLDDQDNKPDFTGTENKVTDTGDHPAVETTQHETYRAVSPSAKSRYQFDSPTLERGETDWEKHISYVSGPDELELGHATFAAPEMKELRAENLAGLGVSGIEMEQRQRSAEDINNSVYKQIQHDNIRRESAISTNSAAIRAGILLPSVGSTPKSVRRRKKCGSLRDGSASEGGRRRSDASSQHVLKHEKRHLPLRRHLEDSPILVPKRGQERMLSSSPVDMRHASSPADLGTDASKRATISLARKLESTTAQDPRSAAEHKLKRQNHAERLSKNMSVRRTSQEVSASDLEEAFNRIDRGAASVRRQKIPAQQRTRMDVMQKPNTTIRSVEPPAQMNQGVKRSKVPSGDSAGPLRLQKIIKTEPESPSSPRRVRRFSREERLENNEQLRRLSSDHTQEPVSENMPGHRRHLSSDSAMRRSSQDTNVLSSPRKSLDARFLQPTTTPMSTSGFSDRTADIEVCEASGVRIYPHNNKSLLVVQQGSRPASKDEQAPDGPTLANIKPNAEPIFAAQIDPPTPVLGSKPDAHVDSPLTNPRAAPEPPQIQFIPATPNEELERELGDDLRDDEGTLTGQLNLPGRNLSFKQKVRRYSDSFFGRSSSFRKAPPAPPPRDTHLSPMWRPQRFWDEDEEYSSDDDYYDDYDYDRSANDRLPPGGDTSHFEDSDVEKRRPFFPRAMSKRLPGFRGGDGFVQGNSLGIDRHGTNNRRHYVSTNSRKRTREEMLNIKHPGRSLSRSRSEESVRSMVRRQQGFKVPFTGGMRAKWVGTQALRSKMRDARVAREEREREKRREVLKRRIGMRVFHG